MEVCGELQQIGYLNLSISASSKFVKKNTFQRLLPFEMKEFGMAKILGNIERNSTSFIVVKIWKEQHPSHLQTKVQLSPIKMQKILDLGTNGGRAELLMIAVQVQVGKCLNIIRLLNQML